MSERDKEPLSAISSVLGSKPVLPGESQSDYQRGLTQLIVELEAKSVLQIYLAEKIYDCLWWIRRYEEQKRAVMVACMAEIVTEDFRAKDKVNLSELREALMSSNLSEETLRVISDLGHSIEDLRRQALTRRARELRALDEQTALQAKILAGFQASYEVAANRKLNTERMTLQNEMLRRDLAAIDVRPEGKSE